MIKLYLDEDVHKKIALSLRLKGYDVISAVDFQICPRKDAKVTKLFSSEFKKYKQKDVLSHIYEFHKNLIGDWQ